MSAEPASPIELARTDEFDLGGTRVQPSSCEISNAGETLSLEPRVMQVLVYLAQRRGQTVTRDDLISACWRGVVVGEDAIQRCIGRLRKAASAVGGFEIQTLNRLGYRLRELSATRDASDASLVPKADAAPAVAAPDTPVPAAQAPTSGSALTFGPFVLDAQRISLQRDGKEIVVGGKGLALFDVLMEAAGGIVKRETLMERAWPGLIVEESNLTVQIAALRKALGTQPDGQEWIATVPRVGYRLTRPSEAPAGAFDGKPSIAVLPFASFSDDPKQGYFADGMVEDLITALSRFKTFAVAARNSSFVYKDRTYDVRDAARALGVRYALEGSVRRAGPKVRVTAQLIDAENGAHIWAEKFDGLLDDVFDFEDAITENVVGAIEPHIRKAEIERARRKRPESLDAYDLYLQALPLIASVEAHNYSQAIELLERAIALDPGFAPALAHASWAHAKRLGSGKAPPPGVDDAAACIALSRRALAADSNDATVLAIAGLHLMDVEGERDRGYSIVMRAFALNPNSFLVANFSGFANRRHGNFDDAISCHLRALRFLPGAPEVIWCLTAIAEAHLSAGRFEEALTWALRSHAIYDRLEWTETVLTSAYAHLGRLDEARDASQIVTAARPGLTIANFFGRNKSPGPHDEFLVAGLVKAGIPRI
jgi:TolB-like protein